MIKRALLIAATAVALSGALRATVLSRTHARSQSSDGALAEQGDAVQGAFCPVRPAGSGQTALASPTPEARMTPVPNAPASANASTPAAEPLLTPAPAICRPASDSAPAQSSVRP